MARSGLSALGPPAADLVQADREHIWISPEAPLDVDFVDHETALRAALHMAPGRARDDALSLALADEGVLLEDEPYADWALRPRERLDELRLRARLELARDRARGSGKSSLGAVTEAWEDCLSHDPTSEEAASALLRVYATQGNRHSAGHAYERCRAALEQLGLRPSPALDEVRATALGPNAGRGPSTPGEPRSAPRGPRWHTLGEHRLVSVVFVELSGPVGLGARLDPEDLRDIVGTALTAVIAEVEGLGGTVTSLSGGGLAALFGAPEAHEDDPERAVRAGFRTLAALGAPRGRSGEPSLSVRVGIETGAAVVGPIAGTPRLRRRRGGGYHRRRPAIGSQALVCAGGPATRAATEEIFSWGPGEEVAVSPQAKPVTASYLEVPKARTIGLSRPTQDGRARTLDRP